MKRLSIPEVVVAAVLAGIGVAGAQPATPPAAPLAAKNPEQSAPAKGPTAADMKSADKTGKAAPIPKSPVTGDKSAMGKDSPAYKAAWADCDKKSTRAAREACQKDVIGMHGAMASGDAAASGKANCDAMTG